MAERKTKVMSLVVFLLSVVVFAALVWVLRNWRGESTIDHGQEIVVEDEPASLREAIRAEEESGVVLPLSVAARSVLEKHFAALGGVPKISSVSSFRMSGTVELKDGKLVDVIVVKKGGNKMRVTERYQDSERVQVISPDDSWTAFRQNSAVLSVEDMPEEEREKHEHHANVVSELWLSFQKNWDTRYIGQRDFNYKMTHVFEVQTSPRHSVRFMIDPDSFLDIGQENRTFEADGSLQITRRIHSDHQEWNGLMVPGKIEVLRNQELVQTIHVKNVAVNPGVLDSVFERPAN